MQLASRYAFPEPPLAAMWQLSENSRLGFRLAGSTLQQGFGAGKYLIGIGDTASVVRYAWLESLKAQQQNSDKNTNVMLSADSIPPKPSHSGVQSQMDYNIVPQANTMGELADKESQLAKDPATQAKYSNMEVRLYESQRGGIWKWFGDAVRGSGHDQLNMFAGYVDQKWYIDGKRAQLVVGKDSNGNLIKAWTVHVVLTNSGPQFSKSD
jgi:hypothetical protein